MKKVVVIVFLFLGILAALLFFCVIDSLRGQQLIEKSPEFNRERFLILLFPAEDGEYCSRAVIASLAEYDRDFIEVYDNNTPVTMSRSRFTPAPPQNYPVYTERLNETLNAWGHETDWRGIEYAVTPVAQGAEAILTVTDKSGSVQKYTYLISGASVHPVKVRMEVNIPKKMSN